MYLLAVMLYLLAQDVQPLNSLIIVAKCAVPDNPDCILDDARDTVIGDVDMCAFVLDHHPWLDVAVWDQHDVVSEVEEAKVPSAIAGRIDRHARSPFLPRAVDTPPRRHDFEVNLAGGAGDNRQTAGAFKCNAKFDSDLVGAVRDVLLQSCSDRSDLLPDFRRDLF